jgi:transcriptional regulator with XRE-family HTH domain
MPADKSAPTALGREIGHQLRLKRQQAGLTGQELSQRLGWTPTKVSRIETGVRLPLDIEIAMYLVRCSATQTEVDAVTAQIDEGSRNYRVIDHSDDVNDENHRLVLHEQAATTIESYEPVCVPALLRTEGYARALLIEAGICSSPVVEHRLESLKKRQAVLQEPHQRNYTFYISENALDTPIGDNLVMNEQLLHITFLSAWNRCTIRVVPRSAKGAGLVKNGFERLTFADMDPLVTLDLETNALFLDSPTDVTRYRAALDRLDHVALTKDESRILIADQSDTYDGAQHINLPAGPQPSAPNYDASLTC